MSLPVSVAGRLSMEVRGFVETHHRCLGYTKAFKKQLASGTRSEKRSVYEVFYAPSKNIPNTVDDRTLGELAFELLGSGTLASNAITFAAWFVANTPGVEERLLKEMEDAFPGNREMPYDTLSQLPYLVRDTFHATSAIAFLTIYLERYL
ncbi:hypothetical protein BDD12DRAFT_874120 [Trichophaea hybrida]|nr:hypothetical protein BDD12DRAFT_874120 [Trichophaea hybrida]